MLLSTLGASLSGNPLTGKGVIRVKAQLELVKIFNSASSFNYFLKQKSIIKMNLNLMMFIQEIVYLKQKMGCM